MRIHPKFAAAFFFLTTTLPALAEENRCAVNPHDSTCALDSTLHLLRWLAIILALILVAIVGVAIIAYRKNQRAKLTSDDYHA